MDQNLDDLREAAFRNRPLPGTYPREFAQPPIVPLSDSVAPTEYEMALEEDYLTARGNAVPPLPEPVTLQEVAPEAALPAAHGAVSPEKVDVPVLEGDKVLKDSVSDPSELELDPNSFPDTAQTSQSLPKPVIAEQASEGLPEWVSASMMAPDARQVKVSPPLKGPSDETDSVKEKTPINQPIRAPVPKKGATLDPGDSMISPAVRQVRVSPPLEGPHAETDSFAGDISATSMLTPGVKQVRVSPPLEGPGSEAAPPLPHFQHWTAEAPEAASEDSESSHLGPGVEQVRSSVLLRGPDNAPVSQEFQVVAPSVKSDASMIAPAIQQVRVSSPLEGPDSERGPQLPHFQPWVSKEEQKAPSTDLESSHIAPPARQVRSSITLKGPHADTESSVESVPETQPVKPAEAPAPPAAVEASTDSDTTSSDGSIDLGNIGGPPKDLPSHISVRTKPAVPENESTFSWMSRKAKGIMSSVLSSLSTTTPSSSSRTVQQSSSRKQVPAKVESAGKGKEPERVAKSAIVEETKPVEEAAQEKPLTPIAEEDKPLTPIAEEDEEVQKPLTPITEEGKPLTPIAEEDKPLTPIAEEDDEAQKPLTPIAEENKPLTPIAEEDKPLSLIAEDKPLTPIAEEDKPLTTIVEKDAKEGKVDDTLTLSRSTFKPEIVPMTNPQLVALNDVNEILSPKKEMELVPIPKDISAPPILNTNPVAGLLKDTEKGPPAVAAGLPQADVPTFAPPAEGSTGGFVPKAAAATTRDSIIDKVVKPAGVAVAALTGIAALVGGVWLFDKAKVIFQRRKGARTGGTAERTKMRRHVRDWNADN